MEYTTDEPVTLYQYKLTNDCKIIKNKYKARIKPRFNSHIAYYIRKYGSYYKSVMDCNLNRNYRGSIYSLEDNYDKYASIIINDYKEKNEKIRREICDKENELKKRKIILEKIIENV